jgi:hypothetical protein
VIVIRPCTYGSSYFPRRSVFLCHAVAISAHRDQVLFRIIPQVAPKLFVVDRQVRCGDARLTLSATAMLDLLLQTLVRCRVPPQARKVLAMPASALGADT